MEVESGLGGKFEVLDVFAGIGFRKMDAGGFAECAWVGVFSFL